MSGQGSFFTSTKELRFVRRAFGQRTLQQAWIEEGTGKIDWRDVPIVSEPPMPESREAPSEEKVLALIGALERITNDEMPVKGLAPGLYGHARRIAEEALSDYYDGNPPCPSCGARWNHNTRFHSTSCDKWPMSKGHETRAEPT